MQNHLWWKYMKNGDALVNHTTINSSKQLHTLLLLEGHVEIKAPLTVVIAA